MLLQDEEFALSIEAIEASDSKVLQVTQQEIQIFVMERLSGLYASITVYIENFTANDSKSKYFYRNKQR